MGRLTAGPLTNLALALKEDPNLPSLLGELVVSRLSEVIFVSCANFA